MKNYIIILAAGKGTRMKVDIPKCVYPFRGKPIIKHIYDNLVCYGFNDIYVVVGYKQQHVRDVLGNNVKYIYQDQQLGTAHAVKCCYDEFKNKKGNCIIIPGDMPLIDGDEITNLIEFHNYNNNSFTILSFLKKEPNYYGKIIRNNGKVIEIKEDKECNMTQKKIIEVNSGVYVSDIKLLFELISKIDDKNNSGEFYLTDIVSILSNKYKVDAYISKNKNKLIGINDLNTLKELEEIIKKESTLL